MTIISTRKVSDGQSEFNDGIREMSDGQSPNLRSKFTERECFLCGRNGQGDRLERHHIFGGARRQLSEKYGLTVYLCGSRCHRDGEYSAHRNKNTALYLHQTGQRMAEEQGMTREEFIKIFGKDYLS